MKSWAVSLILHAAAVTLAAVFWTERIAEPKPGTMRWTVAFARPQPPQEPSVQSPPEKPQPPVSPLRQTRTLPSSPAASAHEPAGPAIPAGEMPPAAASAPSATDPPPAAPPAPPAQDAAAVPSQAHAGAEIERRWYLALLEQLRALKRYPPAARRLGLEGVVLIEARIGTDGRLEDAKVKQGSGHPMLDRCALELFESAASRARDRLRPEHPTRLEIPIAFKLES